MKIIILGSGRVGIYLANSLYKAGHKVTVVTDGMGAFLMRERRVGVFITAADRVCMDGTICNSKCRLTPT